MLGYDSAEDHCFIWDSTRENLSLRFTNIKGSDLCIRAVWSAPLLFAFWKVFYLFYLLIAKFEFSS